VQIAESSSTSAPETRIWCLLLVTIKDAAPMFHRGRSIRLRYRHRPSWRAEKCPPKPAPSRDCCGLLLIGVDMLLGWNCRGDDAPPGVPTVVPVPLHSRNARVATSARLALLAPSTHASCNARAHACSSPRKLKNVLVAVFSGPLGARRAAHRMSEGRSLECICNQCPIFGIIIQLNKFIYNFYEKHNSH
jgi:hypothetical protein